MKKIITAIILLFTLLFNVSMFSACSVIDSVKDMFVGDTTKEDDNEGVKPPVVHVPVDVETMLSGKYSDFELSREKLEYARDEALKKVDYMIRRPCGSSAGLPQHKAVQIRF